MKRLLKFIDNVQINYPQTKSIVQFLKFGFVGALNVIISLSVYWLCYYVFSIHYQLANAIGFFVSVVNSYIWNSRFVFHKQDSNAIGRQMKTFVKTLTCYGITYLASAFLLNLWVVSLNVSPGFAPIINIVITTPLNFLMNKFWAFN